MELLEQQRTRKLGGVFVSDLHVEACSVAWLSIEIQPGIFIIYLPLSIVCCNIVEVNLKVGNLIVSAISRSTVEVLIHLCDKVKPRD